MRIKITIIVILLIQSSLSLFSQNKRDVKSQADSAIESFKWDIKKSDKGYIMFLDIPFTRENQTSLEFITLTVAKDKSKKRPDFISIIVPNNILQSNGLFIAFADRKNSEISIDKESLIRIGFENCNSQDCTARIIDCSAVDLETNNKHDILDGFLTHDQFLILLVYPDKSHKSVMIPLFTFKNQYKELYK